MAKKKSKGEEEAFIISSDQFRKMERKVRRDQAIEKNSFIRGGIHKTSKDDEDERTSRSLSKVELEELIEEEEILDPEEQMYIDEFGVLD